MQNDATPNVFVFWPNKSRRTDSIRNTSKNGVIGQEFLLPIEQPVVRCRIHHSSEAECVGILVGEHGTVEVLQVNLRAMTEIQDDVAKGTMS